MLCLRIHSASSTLTVGNYFRYPETCNKTIEEIEEMFAKGAPPAWTTKKGGSRLDAMIEAVIERKAHGEDEEKPVAGQTEVKNEV
jgi:hypothetical protein